MIIYNQRLAGFLMTQGFVLQGMERDHNQSGRNVFHFKESEQLLSKINEYKNSNQSLKTN